MGWMFWNLKENLMKRKIYKHKKEKDYEFLFGGFSFGCSEWM